METDEWISAAEAVRLVSSVMGHDQAVRAICSRAHAGLIEARAARFLVGERSVDNVAVPTSRRFDPRPRAGGD